MLCDRCALPIIINEQLHNMTFYRKIFRKNKWVLYIIELFIIFFYCTLFFYKNLSFVNVTCNVTNITTMFIHLR